MESDFKHHILVVEGDKQTRKIIQSVLSRDTIHLDFSPTGEAAIETIKKVPKPFSLIVSAQRLDGMSGTTFLEQAQSMSPDSVRFLMAAYSEIEMIINAVNQSAVQRFMIKPFEAEDFSRAIQSGLDLYQAFYDHERLLRLAKKQNAQLYELNCQFMESTRSNTKKIHELERDIQTLTQKLKQLSAGIAKREKTCPSGELKKEMERYLENAGGSEEEKLVSLYSKTIYTLYDQFDEVAGRNGFEMPVIDGETK